MEAEYFVNQSSVVGLVGIAADAPVVEQLKPGLEVELLVSEGDDRMYLRLGEAVADCEFDRRSRAQLLGICSDQSRARLCVVQHVQPAQDLCAVTVAVRRLGPQLCLDRLQLVVDERVYESIRDLDPSVSTPAVANAWLTNRLVLGRVGRRGLPRILCGRGAESEGGSALGQSFSIVGEGVRADIKLRGSLTNAGRFEYAIERVSTFPSGRMPPVKAVAEAEVSFIDACESDSVRAAVDSQMSAIMKDETTFLGLWKHYQEAEVRSKIEEAEAMGFIPYNSVQDRGDGKYCLVVPAGHAVGAKIEVDSDVGLRAEERSIEALEQEFLESIGKQPSILLDNELDLESASRNQRQAEVTAKVLRVEHGGLHVVVMCSGDTAPPAQGYIGPTIVGDIMVQRRRAEAVRRIAEGSAAMAQLGLIIDESGPLTRRRRGSDRPLTPKLMERVFTDEKGRSWNPTPRQKKAIEVALNTPDIAVIQGPPGTGKTTVMRAIIERINELNAKDPEREERFLVTGFQHDAVENAIEKLSVNGLPAIKFGGRRSDRGGAADDEELRLDQFVEDIYARSSVRARGQLAMYEELRTIEEEVAELATRPLSPAAAAAALRSISARFGARLSGGLGAQIADLAERFEREASTEVDEGRERLERAIRAIRCVPAAFADDGARNAALALALLDRRGERGDLSLLERCADWSGPRCPPFLAEVEVLRNRLLLAHARRLGTEAIPIVNDEFLGLLEAARREILTRAQQQATGDSLAVARLHESLQDREALRDAIRHYSVVIASTCQQSVSKAVVEHLAPGPEGVNYHTVLCDEAARANPLDLLIPMTRAERRIVLVGDHRQLPHIVEDGIAERLAGQNATDAPSGEDGDDAKSIATEIQKALKQSLFERIFQVLREREQQDGIPRVITLDEQYRMHPRLGTFVSKQFYPENERFRSPRPAKDFEHDFEPFVGRCAVWHDVPGDRETGGRSKSRPAESREIVRLLKPMLERAVEQGSKATFGVITFYSAQVAAIEDELVRAGILVREGGAARCADRYIGRLRVGSVDAFQGREFDAVFLSVVRSNRLEEDKKRYGHLMVPNRLCVSMSRQKKLLVVVGDLKMVRDARARVAIPQLVAFEELARSEAAEARAAGRPS
jgi:hypothetical protein